MSIANNIKDKISTLLQKCYECLWCVDRVSIGILLLLVGLSCFELISSLHIIELRLSKNVFLFKKHICFVIIFFINIMILSNFSPSTNILIGGIVGLSAVVLCVLTLVLGVSINGSKRWIHLVFITLQPSVFLKNTLAIFLPYLFRSINSNIYFVGICGVLLLLQPDFGMCLLLIAIAATQIILQYEEDFKRYAYLILVGGVAFMAFICFKGGYFINRVAGFFSARGLYQSNIALQNIKNTSLFGSNNAPAIPDAPTDFIVASIISHYGVFAGMLVVFLFVLFFIRNIQHASFLSGRRRIIVYGILAQIAYQSIFHLASNLNFIPPKGVSCPFLSYGGSELLASIFSVGTLLSLTKKRMN